MMLKKSEKVCSKHFSSSSSSSESSLGAKVCELSLIEKDLLMIRHMLENINFFSRDLKKNYFSFKMPNYE